MSTGQQSGNQNPGISKIYYYFEQHTSVESGRTVGRKIGVVQEIIIRKLLLQSQRLADAVSFEPYLHGFSGASHKVEFVFYQPIGAFEFSIGQSHRVQELEITLVGMNSSHAVFKILNGKKTVRSTFLLHQVVANANYQTLLSSARIRLKLSTVQAERVRLVVLDWQDVLASVESKRVGAQRFAGSEKLGSGIQTIEKAKQAALVAIDADLMFNEKIKAQMAPNTLRRYISVVVLGNGVHWTEKDKRILRTFVDYTFLIPDETIIRYADYVRSLSEETGEPFLQFFMSYFKGMTNTPPDSFAVDSMDFQIVQPEAETRSLIEVLEGQIDDYLVEPAS
jgi:hypothetical protein